MGYARVSATEQNPDPVDELTAAGCWKVWTDRASEALDRRPQPSSLGKQSRPFRDHRQVLEGMVFRYRTWCAAPQTLRAATSTTAPSTCAEARDTISEP